MDFTDKIIKINVGGTIFHVPIDILNNIPYFSNIISDIQIDDEIFVRRPSKYFDQIIAFAMDPDFTVVVDDYVLFKKETDFYDMGWKPVHSIIKVIVGGMKFHVHRDVLYKIPYFVDKYSDLISDKIILHRSYEYFGHILSIAKTERCKFVIQNYALFNFEVNFYGLKYDIHKSEVSIPTYDGAVKLPRDVAMKISHIKNYIEQNKHIPQIQCTSEVLSCAISHTGGTFDRSCGGCRDVCYGYGINGCDMK